MGGMCCDWEQGLEPSQTVKSLSCHACGCGHDESENPAPARESHDHCQTCLCGGALPAGSSVAELLPDELAVVEFVPLKWADTDPVKVSHSIEQSAESPPPFGRGLLALHRSLLL